jgi:4'-phosphopantetheinyl transferase
MAPAASCEIHWARLDSLRTTPAGILDSQETERAARHVLPEEYRRFTVAAVLLRTLLGRRLRVDPRAVAIDRTCALCNEPHGRPRVLGTDIEVSVSHSGQLVAVAISEAGPVGVDIEQLRRLDYRAVGRRVFTDRELDATRDPSAFFALWTRKESVLKAAGVGLHMPMTQVLVTPAEEQPRLLRLGDATPPARMVDAAPIAGYAGAATVLTSKPVAFRLANADDLLVGFGRAVT